MEIPESFGIPRIVGSSLASENHPPADFLREPAFIYFWPVQENSDLFRPLSDTISQDVVFPRAFEEFSGPSFDRRILNRITLRNANFQRAIRAPDFEPK